MLKSCEILFDINFAFFALYHPFIFLRQMNANRRPLNISFSLWFLKSRNLKLSWIIVIKRHSHLTLYLFKYLCYFISKLLLCFSCFLLPHLLTLKDCLPEVMQNRKTEWKCFVGYRGHRLVANLHRFDLLCWTVTSHESKPGTI